ncbi:hypothetical protein niasHT_006239 [Heterodera trifolii]|uniref:Uncharacterized protein n=1 Tax=Heterodera trifolii TaxID=157864 RepID=A0ABD2M1Q4_9BILA
MSSNSSKKTLQSVVEQVIQQEAELKSSVKPSKENDLEKSERKPTHTIYNLFDHQRSFWKLARPKFAVINFLCPGCRRINYKHKDQFKLMGEDEFHFTQVMCPGCVKYNMMQTDTYNKHTKNPH